MNGQIKRSTEKSGGKISNFHLFQWNKALNRFKDAVFVVN